MNGATIDALLRTPIAHRGLHDAGNDIPENSFAAFRAACEHSFPIELDVRLLADGQVAVFHDAGMLRLTGVDAALETQTRSMLANVRLLGTRENIPLLGDVLDFVSGRVPVLIELKSRGRPDRLERAVAEILKGRRDCAVQAFSPRSIEWFRQHAPQVPRGLVMGRQFNRPSRRFDASRLASLAYCVRHRPDFINHEHTGLGSAALRRFRSRDVPILCWTIRSAAEMRAAHALCDNFIFEGFDPLAGNRPRRRGKREPR